MLKIKELIREDLRDFKPYVSARSKQHNANIWLNANELPFDNQLNRYPDQQPEALLNVLADYYSLKKEQILMMRGSNEGIDLLTRLFCEAKKDSIMICPPTFGMYEISAKLQGAKVIKVPLNKNDFSLKLPEIKSKTNIKLIFLCSPNNPTGNIIPIDTILALCQYFLGKAIIVVDEAYIEFSESESVINYIDQTKNLVVLRTLSKAIGLAATRIGVVLSNSTIIHHLKNILTPFPLPKLDVDAAVKSIKCNIMSQQIHIIISEREFMIKALRELACVEKVWLSKANFILVKFNKNVERCCLESGMVLRNQENQLGVENIVRISIGTPEENAKLLTVLRKR